jgi:Putative zinc-finger
MKCKQAKKLVILDLYGELEEPAKHRLQEHLDECAECRAEFDLTKKVFAVLDVCNPAVEPSADWDKAWDRVQTGIAAPPAQREPARVPAWRWAYAGTGLVLILAAGIFIGKYAFTPSSSPAGTQAAAVPAAPNGIQPAFAAHLEDLKPILLDYAHYVPGEKSGQKIFVDADILRGFVLQNILLKRKLVEKDPAAADLLEDLDLVLKEITNRGTDDPQAPARVRDLIEQRDVLFKMEIMKKI